MEPGQKKKGIEDSDDSDMEEPAAVESSEAGSNSKPQRKRRNTMGPQAWPLPHAGHNLGETGAP